MGPSRRDGSHNDMIVLKYASFSPHTHTKQRIRNDTHLSAKTYVKMILSQIKRKGSSYSTLFLNQTHVKST